MKNCNRIRGTAPTCGAVPHSPSVDFNSPCHPWFSDDTECPARPGGSALSARLLDERTQFKPSPLFGKRHLCHARRTGGLSEMNLMRRLERNPPERRHVQLPVVAVATVPPQSDEPLPSPCAACLIGPVSPEDRPRPPLLRKKNRRPSTDGSRPVILAILPPPELESNFHVGPVRWPATPSRLSSPCLLIVGRSRVATASTTGRHYRSSCAFVNWVHCLISHLWACGGPPRATSAPLESCAGNGAPGPMSRSHRQLCPAYWSVSVASQSPRTGATGRQNFLREVLAAG